MSDEKRLEKKSISAVNGKCRNELLIALHFMSFTATADMLSYRTLIDGIFILARNSSSASDQEGSGEVNKGKEN